MHACIAAYTDIMATATHTALGNAVSALDKAKSLLGPQAEPFLDNLVQFLKMVQPLAAATALLLLQRFARPNASRFKEHCKGHQATANGSSSEGQVGSLC